MEALSIPRANMQDRQPQKGYRACFECRRKKTRCDMLQPSCSLCQRVGASCTFPTRRKPPEFKTANRRTSQASPRRDLDWLANVYQQNQRDRNGVAGRRTSQKVLATCRSSRPDDSEQNWSLPTLGQANVANTQEAHAASQASLITRDNLQQPTGFIALDLPVDLATDLIDSFFVKIQPWLPIFHEPRFRARFIRNGNLNLSGKSIEEAMILYGMFALAARFSDHTTFADTLPDQRGEMFLVKARTLYDRARAEVEQSNNLAYLQGCILMAFYSYASGPCPRGWVLTGVCVRLAYEMGLDTLDDDSEDDSPTITADWSTQEELRRAWWLVWELDAFGSTISRRPYAIDRRRMIVKLPVSDDAWFSDQHVSSNVLHVRPAQAWKSLRDCENQDERAWFLVANYLMILSNDLAHSRTEHSNDEVQEISNSITCFELLLPRQFRLDKVRFKSGATTSASFIISIHLMIMSAKNGVIIHEAKKSLIVASPHSNASTSDMEATYSRLPDVIQHWSPEHIHQCHPFIACMMVPLHFGPSLPAFNNASDEGMLEDMTSLVLSRFAEYWQLGKILLQICEVIKRETDNLNSQELDLAKRFAVFFPRRIAKAAASPNAISNSRRPTSQNNINVPNANASLQQLDAGTNDMLTGTETMASFGQNAQFDLQAELGEAWLPAMNYFYDQEADLDFLSLQQ